MFKLLFDASMIYDIILLIVIGLIVIACFKSSWGKYVFFSLVSIILIATGVYSFFNVNNYLNASGGIWGTIVGDYSVNKVEVSKMQFDLQYIELTQTSNTDENIYSAKLESNETVSIENGKYYGCYVNGVPIENDEFSSEYLIANYTYNFYDFDKNLIISDTLKLRFSFFENYTVFVLQTEGGSTAVKQWNNFFKNNNFVVSLDLLDNQLEVESYLDQFIKVDFVVVDDKQTVPIKSVYCLPDSCLSVLSSELSSDKYDLLNWKINDVEIDLNTYVFKENTVVNADYSYKIYILTVDYSTGPNTVNSKNVSMQYGDVYSETPTHSDFEFLGYALKGTYDIQETYTVTGDAHLNTVWQPTYTTDDLYREALLLLLDHDYLKDLTATTSASYKILSFSGFKYYYSDSSSTRTYYIEASSVKYSYNGTVETKSLTAYWKGPVTDSIYSSGDYSYFSIMKSRFESVHNSLYGTIYTFENNREQIHHAIYSSGFFSDSIQSLTITLKNL